MIARQILAIVAPTVAHSVRRWIFHLGGLGFIPLGLLDNSVIPLPGSMDVLTIVLAARKQELCLYYALTATIGSVIGGYVTYRLARKGGKETLERKFPAQTLEKGYRIFGRWGLGPSPSLPPCCHRRCTWFHFSLLQAQCNIPWENSWWRSRSAGLSDIPSWRSWRPITDGKCSRSCRNLDIRSSSPLSC